MFAQGYNSQKDLVVGLVQSNALKTPLVTQAFKAIDRKDFVLPAFQDEAYLNDPISIGQGQTISQPWTVAFMLELLSLQPGQKVLDIGSGSGWTTAILAYIVGQAPNPKLQIPNPKVFAIEIVPELCKLGERNCEKYGFVSSGVAQFFCQDGSLGLPEQAPFDRILCSAALPELKLPPTWQEQLKIGGRIVTPIKNSILVFDKVNEKDLVYQEYEGFAFVPFVRSSR